MTQSPLEAVASVAAAQADAVDHGIYPTHTLDALRAAGLLGLLTPAEHGGQGGTLRDAALVVRRIARACGSSGMVLCMHYCGAAVLARLGSAELNRAVAAGRHLSTLAFSETGSRSHFWAPLSTATPDGDEVVLHAHKSWITSAAAADAYVWSSRPLAAPGASTLWLVPKGAPGLRRVAAYEGLGLRGNDSTSVVAEGVRVARAAQLGADGAGFEVMMGVVLPVFSVLNAACALGLGEAALEGASAHAVGTGFAHLGSQLRELPTIRAYLARARVQLDMAAALWEDTLAALEAGRPDATLRVLEVKAACGEATAEVTRTAMRVCGGAAYRKELGVERAFRDAQAMGVMAPTTDMLYDFIGKVQTGMELFA